MKEDILKQQLDFSTDWRASELSIFLTSFHSWLVYQRMLHNASRSFHASQITKPFLDGILSICRYSRFNGLRCAGLGTVFISILQLFVYLVSLVMVAYWYRLWVLERDCVRHARTLTCTWDRSMPFWFPCRSQLSLHWNGGLRYSTNMTWRKKSHDFQSCQPSRLKWRL